MVAIGFAKLAENVTVPTYSREGDACMDIRTNQSTVIKPKETQILKTGIKIQYIPEGVKLCLVARSGLSSKGLQIANAPAQIDQNYRGEIGIIVYNSSNEDFEINEGDRVAQIYPERVLGMEFIEATREIETNRGSEGFGSSGRA